MSKDRTAYHQQYWQSYTKARHRVYGTLSAAHYREVKRIADRHKRGVWSQIWAESCSYRHQERLLPQDMENSLREIKLELRQINGFLREAIHSEKSFARIFKDRAFDKALQNAEARLEQAVRSLTPEP